MDRFEARREVVAMIRAAEPNPNNWLLCVVRIADATGRVKAERLPILGSISLDLAVNALLSEAEKHGLSLEDVVSVARTAL